MMIYGTLICALAAAAPAANFSGKWAIVTDGRGGASQQTTLVLNQVGVELEGTLTPPVRGGDSTPVDSDIIDGKVDGDTVMFYVWTGSDRPQKAFYKGTLTGDQITFTVTSGAGSAPAGTAGNGSARSGPQQVVAKRTK
jgi:hypothetical protein